MAAAIRSSHGRTLIANTCRAQHPHTFVIYSRLFEVKCGHLASLRRKKRTVLKQPIHPANKNEPMSLFKTCEPFKLNDLSLSYLEMNYLQSFGGSVKAIRICREMRKIKSLMFYFSCFDRLSLVNPQSADKCKIG